MNESCHTYEWVMSHIWMSHVTHMDGSCSTYEWVMSNMALLGAYGKPFTWSLPLQKCISYEWVMSHICMRHDTNMNESCHTYAWDMTQIWMSHVTRRMRHRWTVRAAEHVLQNMFPHRWTGRATRMPESCHMWPHCERVEHVLWNMFRVMPAIKDIHTTSHLCSCTLERTRVYVWSNSFKSYLRSLRIHIYLCIYIGICICVYIYIYICIYNIWA